MFSALSRCVAFRSKSVVFSSEDVYKWVLLLLVNIIFLLNISYLSRESRNRVESVPSVLSSYTLFVAFHI